MLTGKGNEAIALKAMKKDINNYLVKGDINQNIFLDSIHKVIDNINTKVTNQVNKVITTLILNDSPEDQETYKKLFLKEKEWKFNIIQVFTKEEALDFCKKTSPNLVILDISLPDSNQLELLKSFTAIIDYQKIPIIIFTEEKSEKEIVKAMKNGAKDYLIKSNLNPESLLQAIKILLSDPSHR